MMHGQRNVKLNRLGYMPYLIMESEPAFETLF